MIKIEILPLGAVNKKTWVMALLAPEIKNLYRNWSSRIIEGSEGAQVEFGHAHDLLIRIYLVNNPDDLQRISNRKSLLSDEEYYKEEIFNITLGEEEIREQVLIAIKRIITHFAPSERELAASIWKEF